MFAQSYPVKPVRFIAPYPAGGVNDIVARVIGQRMSQALGQQWLVENRPGRGGSIGSTPEEFLAVIKDDLAKWSRVIRENGIRGE